MVGKLDREKRKLKFPCHQVDCGANLLGVGNFLLHEMLSAKKVCSMPRLRHLHLCNL